MSILGVSLQPSLRRGARQQLERVWGPFQANYSLIFTISDREANEGDKERKRKREKRGNAQVMKCLSFGACKYEKLCIATFEAAEA